MRQIVVYVDEGVGAVSLRHTVRSLSKEMDTSQVRLKRMDAEALQNEEWEDETDLLVIPGGRDVFYHNKLKGKGAERIGEYIHSGGSYLGICAGAYFAASEIEFEKGGSLEVCAKRSLSFFPGRAVGPAYGSNKYHCESDRGAEAALVCWKEELYSFAFYNGGCLFESPEKHSEVTVLGRYAELQENPAAVISCAVGKGRALLTGVHLEYSLAGISCGSPYLAPLVSKLKKTENRRRLIFREVLEHLQLAISS